MNFDTDNDLKISKKNLNSKNKHMAEVTPTTGNNWDKKRIIIAGVIGGLVMLGGGLYLGNFWLANTDWNKERLAKAAKEEEKKKAQNT